MRSMIISARILKLIPKQVCSQKIYIYSTSSEIAVLISQKVVSLMLKGSIFYSVSPVVFDNRIKYGERKVSLFMHLLVTRLKL